VVKIEGVSVIRLIRWWKLKVWVSLGWTGGESWRCEKKKEPTDDTSKDVYSLLAQHVSSPTLMMHGHMNLKFEGVSVTRLNRWWKVKVWVSLGWTSGESWRCECH